MTFREALDFGSKKLHDTRDAELLLAHASGKTRETFLTHPESRLTAAAEKKFRSFVARRRKREPVAYILGSVWFLGKEYFVTRDTLIPRWATEHLVLAAVASAKKHRPGVIVDVGTGSGCVAVSLALELPSATIIATDASLSALAVARKNAKRHGVADRIRFMRGDLMVPAIPRLSAGPLMVVANLPYLPSADIAALPPDIRRFEPRSALDGGTDGLELYRRLLTQLSAIDPIPPLLLFFEILPEQYAPLAKLLKKQFPGIAARKIFNPSGICVGTYGTIK